MVGNPSLRVYDVGGLVGKVSDRPGIVRDLFRAYAEGRFARGDEKSEQYPAWAPEDLRTMIMESIATDTWESGPARFAITGTHLVVSHARGVHDQIRELLRSFEACLGPPIGIRARILRVTPSALDAAGPGPVLTDGQVQALEAAAAELAQPFPECRLVALNGQRNNVTQGRDFLFLAGKSDGEPSTRSARDGVVLDVQPLYARGAGVPAIVRLFASSGDTTSERLVRMPFLQVATSVVVPRTGWLLFAAGTLRPPADGKTEEQAVVVLLTAEVGPWPRPESFLEKPDPGAPPIRALLAGKTLTVNYMDVPLETVVADLGKRLGVNILIDPRVRECKSEDELLVQLSVKDLPGKEVLALILNLKGLGFVIEKGVILVMPQEFAMFTAPLEIVPVHDLIAALPRFEAERRDFPSREHDPTVIEEREDTGLNSDELVCLVKENLAPETWDTPPNQISFRQRHLFIRNQQPILAKVDALLESLRQAKWRRVQVDGRFLAAPAGWAEGLGIRGAVLTPAQCDAVEKSLKSEGPPVRDRFRIHGCAGRRFCASGGRQIVFAEGATGAGRFDTAPALDGWCAEVEAAPAIEDGRMTLAIDARDSAYLPPEDLLEDSGVMSSSEFKADLRLEDGGGALLGSASPKDGRGAPLLLYVRARFVK